MKKQKYNNNVRSHFESNNIAYYYDHLYNFHAYNIYMFFERFYFGKDREKLLHNKYLVKLEDSLKYLIKRNNRDKVVDFKHAVVKKRKSRSFRSKLRISLEFESNVKYLRSDMMHHYYNPNEDHMTYISDRWRCTGRMLYMLDLINKIKEDDENI